MTTYSLAVFFIPGKESFMNESNPTVRANPGALAVRLGVAVAALLLLAMFVLLGRAAMQQSDTIKSLEERPVIPERSETQPVPPTLSHPN